MTSAQTTSGPIELRELSWVGVGLCAVGGMVLLGMGSAIVLLLFNPPPNPPPLPGGPYIVFVVGALLLGIGIYLLRNGFVGVRIKHDVIEFPRLDVAIAWKHLAEVEVVHAPLPLLVIRLTPEGKGLVGNRLLSNSPQANAINPRPDLCVKFNFVSLGPGIDSLADFATDLRKRAAATSSAVVDDTPPLPQLDGPLEPRDTTEAGPFSRVFVHDRCGGATAITDGSLQWVTNPLRYMGGVQCARCGKAFESEVRWIDTGETLSRFRSRMWRKTPLVYKLVQFLIVPALIGLLAAILSPPMPNMGLMASQVITFVAGASVGMIVIWITPLADVIPGIAGLKYHEYR